VADKTGDSVMTKQKAIELMLKRVDKLNDNVRSLNPVIQRLSDSVAKEQEDLRYRIHQLASLINQFFTLQQELKADAETLKSMLEGKEFGRLSRQTIFGWMFEANSVLQKLSDSTQNGEMIVIELGPQDQVNLLRLIESGKLLITPNSLTPPTMGIPQESEIVQSEISLPLAAVSVLQSKQTPKGSKMPSVIKSKSESKSNQS
jgi:uncharacterized coiled-coil protein SlyX